jgi:hypothetical protein
MISCMCFKRKAYNLYSILTIFKPPNKCLKVLDIFKDKCNDIVLGQYNTKTLYNLLLNSDKHVIKIIEILHFY